MTMVRTIDHTPAILLKQHDMGENVFLEMFLCENAVNPFGVRVVDRDADMVAGPIYRCPTFDLASERFGAIRTDTTAMVIA